MAVEKNVRVEIKLGRVRGSFLDLFVPRAVKNAESDKLRYGATAILDPNNPLHAQHIEEIRAGIEEVKKRGWRNGAPAKTKVEFFDKGEAFRHSETNEVYEGYEGMYAIRANAPEERAPFVFDATGQKVSDAKSSEFYSGAYYHMKMTIYPTETGGSPRVCCGLESVKKYRDGDPLAGRGHATAEEFADFDADDDDAFEGTGL